MAVYSANLLASPLSGRFTRSRNGMLDVCLETLAKEVTDVAPRLDLDKAGAGYYIQQQAYILYFLGIRCQQCRKLR